MRVGIPLFLAEAVRFPPEADRLPHEPVKVGGLVNRCNPKGPLWGSITCADVRRERDSNPRPDCSERQFSKLLH